MTDNTHQGQPPSNVFHEYVDDLVAQLRVINRLNAMTTLAEVSKDPKISKAENDLVDAYEGIENAACALREYLCVNDITGKAAPDADKSINVTAEQMSEINDLMANRCVRIHGKNKAFEALEDAYNTRLYIVGVPKDKELLPALMQARTSPTYQNNVRQFNSKQLSMLSRTLDLADRLDSLSDPFINGKGFNKGSMPSDIAQSIVNNDFKTAQQLTGELSKLFNGSYPRPSDSAAAGKESLFFKKTREQMAMLQFELETYNNAPLEKTPARGDVIVPATPVNKASESRTPSPSAGPTTPPASTGTKR